MDWGIFVRRPNAAGDAERTYSLVVTQTLRALENTDAQATWLPWPDVFARATKDAAAVEQVKAYGELLRRTGTLSSTDDGDVDACVAAALHDSYAFVTQVVGLKELPTSLAAGWCWLQWLEQR